MALVRRTTVMGQTPPVYIGHATVPAAGAPPIPRQPGPGDSDGPPPAPPGAGTDQAASAPSKPASPLAILTAFGCVALGAAIAWLITRGGHGASPFKVGNQTSAYAAATAFAAAVERFLEPFSQYLPGRKLKTEYERLVAALANRNPAATLEAIATAKAKLDRSTANRTVLIWGIASGLATVVCAAGGFYLLRMIAADGWHPAGIPLWVDALVTGLVVGTGTKPLHDLISRWQSNRGAGMTTTNGTA